MNQSSNIQNSNNLGQSNSNGFWCHTCRFEFKIPQFTEDTLISCLIC